MKKRSGLLLASILGFILIISTCSMISAAATGCFLQGYECIQYYCNSWNVRAQNCNFNYKCDLNNCGSTGLYHSSHTPNPYGTAYSECHYGTDWNCPDTAISPATYRCNSTTGVREQQYNNNACGSTTGTANACTASSTYWVTAACPTGQVCNGSAGDCIPCTPLTDNISGGNHCGLDWVLSSNTVVAGNHYNIGNFIVNPGVNVAVKAYNGSDYGFFQVNANYITINGTIDASGAGYGGGGGGGGGGGNANGGGGQTGRACGGTGGTGVFGGLSGITGNCDNGATCTSGAGGNGGNGGGSFNGTFGNGGTAVSRTCGHADQINNHGNNGGSGSYGRYCNGITDVCDTSIDESLNMGSGGGGGGGGSGGAGYFGGGGGGGSGAGNPGAGYVKLYAVSSIIVPVGGNILAKGKSASTGNGIAGATTTHDYEAGAGGTGGSASSAQNSASGAGGASGLYYGGTGGTGGVGAGGGILLKATNIVINGTIDNRGGSNINTNGGTIKIFCGSGGIIGGLMSFGRLYNNSACGVLPVWAYCGNGKNETGESCDDGNTNNIDGCLNDCTIQSGWNCAINSTGATICMFIPIASCNNTCSPNGTLDFSCSATGNNVTRSICGNYTGACLTWGDYTFNKTCAANQFCSYGNCTTTPPAPKNFCLDYKAENECKAYNATIANNDLNNRLMIAYNKTVLPAGGFCGTNNLLKSSYVSGILCNYTAFNCSCGWMTANGNSSCGIHYDTRRVCANPAVVPTAVGTCSISTFVEDRCASEGKIVQKSTATWSVSPAGANFPAEPGCQDSEIKYDCPETAKLPFFGFWNMIVAMISIALIYAFFRKSLVKKHL